MTSPTHSDAAALFVDTWSVYDRIVAGNYMYHREIFTDVGRYLRARFGGHACSVCDLGCGNAAHLARALAGLTLRAYHGCDLSETALAQAQANISELGLEADLSCADLSDYLRECSDRFDLIFSSFALHHLRSEEKAEAFRQIARNLRPKGLFLLVDIVRDENEPLESYLQTYCDWIRSDWNGLSPEDTAAICEHVSGNDWAETAADLNRMAAASGLAVLEPVGKYRQHHILAFEKPAG